MFRVVEREVFEGDGGIFEVRKDRRGYVRWAGEGDVRKVLGYLLRVYIGEL